MMKKEKKRGKQTGKSEEDNLLKKLSRSDLLELLLEQTRRADDLEKQLTRALKERDDNDNKLKDVLTLSKFAIEMIDKEAGQRAQDIIEKQIAEGKLIRTEDIKSKLAEYEEEQEQQAAAEPEPEPVHEEEPAETEAVQESSETYEEPEVQEPVSVPEELAGAELETEPEPESVPEERDDAAPEAEPVEPDSDASEFIDENGFIDVAKIFGCK